MAKGPRGSPRFALDQWLRLLFILLAIGATSLLFSGTSTLVRAAVFAAVCVAILLAKRLRPSLFETPKARLILDADGARRTLGERIVEQVRWDQLVRISIVTTDDGPGAEDFFWLLHAGDGTGCLVPHGQACELDLLARLQRLPRFDNSAVIRASGSASREQFLCWEGVPGEGIPASQAPAKPEAES